MALTGMETWAIIAPVLAAEMVTKHDIATDAYITTFHAKIRVQAASSPGRVVS